MIQWRISLLPCSLLQHPLNDYEHVWITHFCVNANLGCDGIHSQPSRNEWHADFEELTASIKGPPRISSSHPKTSKQHPCRAKVQKKK